MSLTFCVSFLFVGQIFSVAVASAVFQSRLDVELGRRIRGPGAEKVGRPSPVHATRSDAFLNYLQTTSSCENKPLEKVISAIRRSLSLVVSLPPDLQRAAQDAYAASLSTVFILAMCAMLISFIARLPVSLCVYEGGSQNSC